MALPRRAFGPAGQSQCFSCGDGRVRAAHLSPCGFLFRRLQHRTRPRRRSLSRLSRPGPHRGVSPGAVFPVRPESPGRGPGVQLGTDPKAVGSLPERLVAEHKESFELRLTLVELHILNSALTATAVMCLEGGRSRGRSSTGGRPSTRRTSTPWHAALSRRPPTVDTPGMPRRDRGVSVRRATPVTAPPPRHLLPTPASVNSRAPAQGSTAHIRVPPPGSRASPNPHSPPHPSTTHPRTPNASPLRSSQAAASRG
ncbi:hypothetical protein QFZ49_002657 [Streptomyces turgidiscabies]|uniref:Uncharacterized protein n=1 Tax=Streptomyces turgidiscabies TaxID=85558 RepID=A0ABU0RL65_9ACTN|nr:hypothetical protein [Streptomyces turgidiscabies]